MFIPIDKKAAINPDNIVSIVKNELLDGEAEYQALAVNGVMFQVKKSEATPKFIEFCEDALDKTITRALGS